MSNAATPKESVVPAAPAAAAPLPVVLDLGKQRRKRIKDLAKGKPGKLMDEVQEALAGLRSEGVIMENAQPVIIIVKERRRRAPNTLLGLR
jgi:hypothetical protein